MYNVYYSCGSEVEFFSHADTAIVCRSPKMPCINSPVRGRLSSIIPSARVLRLPGRRVWINSYGNSIRMPDQQNPVRNHGKSAKSGNQISSCRARAAYLLHYSSVHYTTRPTLLRCASHSLRPAGHIATRYRPIKCAHTRSGYPKP